MRRALLAVSVVLTLNGCFARFDGEGPIRRGDQAWREVGGGEGGVILRGVEDPGAYRITTPSGVKPLRTSHDLHGACISTERLTRLAGGRLVEHRITGESLDAGELIATVEGARLFARDGSDLAVATPGLVVAGRADALRGVWQGDAAALAVDSQRRRVWVVGRGELRAIDCVDLDQGQVLFRVPLPSELDSASVRIVLSGESAAVYALDRTIEGALLVSPRTRRVIPLLAMSSNQVQGGSCDDGSVPPLIVPAEQPPPAPAPQRDAWAPPAPLGRIAPYPGERFLVIGTHGQWGRLAVSVVANQNEPGVAPLRFAPTLPEGWTVTEGVGWDETGVVLTSRDQRVVFGPRGSPEILELEPGLTRLRHGVNHALNVLILAGEITGGTVLMGGVVTVVVATFPIWIWPVLAAN